MTSAALLEAVPLWKGAAAVPLWKASRPSRSARARILDGLTPRLRREIVRAVSQAVGGAAEDAVREALQRGDLAAAERAIPWDRVLQPAVTGRAVPIVREALETAGAFEARGVLADLELAPGSFHFDVTDRSAAEWIRSEGARLVSRISSTRRLALREVIAAAQADGTSYVDLARLIVDGKMVGLIPQHARAVTNQRRAMIAQGVPRPRAQELAARYSRRLLNWRAETLARSELVAASAEGQIASFRQAVASGILQPGEAVMRWVTVDPCEICAPLEGETAQIGGTFPGGYSRPGQPHPRCECMIVLEIRKRGRRA